ncbi:hypothetical protein T484DRAFT_1831016 [Baffinella frigidus]|nr:hypothetical protein T484DRAFT_1831016 [Cryptophyta sp. CCMP2293]
MLARLFAASLDLLDSAGERAEGGEDPSLAGQGGKSLRQRQLHQNVEDAMESEDYDTARTLQKELNFMSLPSQTGMRASEHQQRVEMHRNMAGAVLKNPDLFSSARGFATDALSSWRTISGAELKFVATPNKATPARGSPSEGTARAHQDGMPSTRLFAGDADKVGNTPGRGSSAGEEPSAAEKDEFQENIELMHLSLGMDPPDLHAAAMCALRMVEIVGDEVDS